MLADSEDQVETREMAPLLKLHWDVLEAIIRTIGSLRAESGGPMGVNGDGEEISHYHFDESSRTSSVTYSPDYRALNHLFRAEWNPGGVRLRGFVHSHPGRMSRPSLGDEVYADRILRAIEDLDSLWLPIINTVPETGRFRLTPWAVHQTEEGVAVVRGQVQVLHMPEQASLTINGEDVLSRLRAPDVCGTASLVLDEIVIAGEKRRASPWERTSRKSSDAEKEAMAPAIVPAPQEAVGAEKPTGPDPGVGDSPQEAVGAEKPAGPEAEVADSRQEDPRWTDAATESFQGRETFDRVREAYDLDLMGEARIVAVGAGGAADFLETMARAGVGQFVLIDPDVVSECNLATQQTYRRDIGRPKVDCIAERIRDINPAARAVAIQKSLDDLSDAEVRVLAADPIDGCKAGRTILCGLTDSFLAQARINRLALHLGMPSLSAQVYREGRGAEMTFTYPGVTPACHRCILSSRYRHFVEEGGKNDVTSHGTPIFATTRLNSIKGFLALAILHHGSSHPRWGAMLSRIGKRNLVQLRLDPDLGETLGLTVFDRVFEGADRARLFFDEVVWLPQDQESPETGYPSCPDCGGTGDLRDAVGRFRDTRLPTPAGPSTQVEASAAAEEDEQTIEAREPGGRTA